MRKILKGLALVIFGSLIFRTEASVINDTVIFFLVFYLTLIGFGFIAQLFIATKKVLYTCILMLLIGILDLILGSALNGGAIVAILIGVVLAGVGAYIGSKVLKNKNQELTVTSEEQTLATPETSADYQWPYQAILGFSFFFGTGAGFLLTWKSMEKLGDKEMARKFLVWGGITFVLLQMVAVFIISKNASLGRSLNILGIAFPVWYLQVLKKWKLQHTENAKFEWSMVLWAVAGLFITLAINILAVYFLGLA